MDVRGYGSVELKSSSFLVKKNEEVLMKIVWFHVTRMHFSKRIHPYYPHKLHWVDLEFLWLSRSASIIKCRSTLFNLEESYRVFLMVVHSLYILFKVGYKNSSRPCLKLVGIGLTKISSIRRWWWFGNRTSGMGYTICIV